MRFPRSIFVRIIRDGNSQYLTCSQSIQELDLEIGDKEVVANYELVDTFNAEVVIKTGKRK